MRRERRGSGISGGLNIVRRNDIKDSIKNVLGDSFQWAPDLVLPSAPTVSVIVTKIEEAPVGANPPGLTIPDAPTVVVSTDVV